MADQVSERIEQNLLYPFSLLSQDASLSDTALFKAPANYMVLNELGSFFSRLK